PDDWTFYIEELVKHSTDGEKSFRAGFKELGEGGYVKRFPIREGNRIVAWETVVYENPLLSGFVQVQSVDVQKLHVGNVHVQNDALLSTDLTKNNITKNDSTKQQLLTKENTAAVVDQSFSEVTNFYEQN